MNEKSSKMNSNNNRTVIEQRSNGVRSENEQKSNSKNSGRSERELEVEILGYEIELDQYKKWYYQAKRENEAVKHELDIERQKNQPLMDCIAKWERGCKECAEVMSKKFADIKATNQKLEQENKVLKRRYDEIKEHKPFTADIYKDSDKLRKLLKLKDMDIKSRDERIEELKMELAQVLARAGRQPIDQDVIDKIIKYKDEGYTYDKIAIYTGVSKSTVSKYIAKYS